MKNSMRLDGNHIEDTMAFVTKRLEDDANPSSDLVKLAMDVLEHELNTMGYDDDCDLEDLLDAFFEMRGHEEDKKRLWDKIDKNCIEEEKFRHWAGRHRFDLSESRLCRCSGCGQERKCVDVPCPSDIPMKTDQMPFCRDCYGEWFYKS